MLVKHCFIQFFAKKMFFFNKNKMYLDLKNKNSLFKSLWPIGKRLVFL